MSPNYKVFQDLLAKTIDLYLPLQTPLKLYLTYQKKVEFNYYKACQSNFEDLKQALCSTPVLRFPNYNQQFILFTDASMYAVGVVLSQLNNDGLDQPVAYFSRTLNKHERNYTATEKECLAVLFGIKECQSYIWNTFQSSYRPLFPEMTAKSERSRWKTSKMGNKISSIRF